MVAHGEKALTQNLGARILARRESLEARQLLEQLRDCIQRHEQSYWHIGDLLVRLVGTRDNHGNRKGGMG